jgi:hypothetical protein
MRQRPSFCIVLLGNLLMLFASAKLDAQQLFGRTLPDIDTLGSSAAVRAVEDVALARRLAIVGEKARSPLALAAAAQILIDNPLIPMGEDGAAVGPGRMIRPRLLSADSLLMEARILSGSDAALGSIITRLDAAARTVPRGTGTGPRQRYAKIGGGVRLVHNVAFLGMEPAVVYVSGDGGTRLELGIFDSQGRLIASEVTKFGDCLVKWVPARSGRYRIEVANRSSTSDWYLLITN